MIHIIGDSHALTFEGAEGVKCHWAGALTAHNLDNKGYILNPILKKVRREDYVWFYLGEIDVRIHIHKKALEWDKNEEELVRNTVYYYLGVINYYEKMYDVAVMAIPPQGTQEESSPRMHRQYLTALFNQYLKEQCDRYNFQFIDIWNSSFDVWPVEDFKDEVHIKSSVAIEKLNNYREGL